MAVIIQQMCDLLLSFFPSRCFQQLDLNAFGTSTARFLFLFYGCWHVWVCTEPTSFQFSVRQSVDVKSNTAYMKTYREVHYTA